MAQSEPITPQTHRIYHIFLASPSDMDEERRMVREFFDGYNRNIANRQNLEFKVIDWEHYSNSGVGRTQQLITRQTLAKFRNSLVLVIGLLGQRFGTSTDIYESGTKEEFATAIRYRQEQGDWPEIKWFFREIWGQQGPPNNPKQLMKSSEQWAKVLAFKKQLQNSDPQLYTLDFATTDDFPAVFRQDLERWLHDQGRPWSLNQSIQSDQTQSATAEQESPYLTIWQNLLARECTHLPLEILDARQGMEQTDPIGLPDIFVPLKAFAPTETWQQAREKDRALARAMTEGGNQEPEPVFDLLQEQRLAVLIGDPGSGKSALVNQLTWSLLASSQPQALPKTLQDRIPLRIILSRVDIPASAKQGKAAWLWQSLEKEIHETLETSQQAGRHAKAVLESIKRKLLQAPGALILLDGLDEVPAADQRRIYLLQAIQDLVASVPKHNHFLITARPYAYTDPHWRLKDFTAFFLTPFDKDQRALFIRGWYAAARSRFSLRNADLQQRIPDLIDQVENQPHLRELAERPLLLTLISTLHASGGRLPDDRAQLFKDSVQLLLYHWRRDVFRGSDGQPLRLDNTELLKCLQTLAYNAHKAQRRQTDAKHTADISREAIKEAFDPMLEDKLFVKDLFVFLQQHTGILIEREQNSFAFPHRSFQEYLAMASLTAHSDDRLSPEVCADPLWWREVFLLAVIEQKNNPRIATLYIRDMLDSGKSQPVENRQRLPILAGLALSELKLENLHPLTQIVRNELLALLEKPTALNVSERAEAGRVLGRIGDRRTGIGLNIQGWPDIDWIKIPPGKIVLEKNAGVFQVETFYLARYPVTQAQFQRFIDDPDGYANACWWAGLNEQPGTPAIPHWSEANHPREKVSWFEAMAFCAWLSERLGLAILLPTEWQWQQAACSGQSAFNYPWGADYQFGAANIRETVSQGSTHFLQRTTAVGIYPQGDSLQGVSDLSGNVWEWCLNGYKNPTDTSAAGTFPRVARGGSLIYDLGYARASSRRYGRPGGRDYYVGFRVCCAPPSER